MRNPAANLLNGLTIFLSALLLFQVEPLIGKIILPWFGGVAAVWTVCLLFFQVALLLGYLYAHSLTRYVRPGTQGWIHTALLFVSLLVLPILPKSSWKPAGPEHPALCILEVLVFAVGLPFYVLSNMGSLLGLLTYPLLIEPRLSISQQGWGWSFTYAAFAVACGIIAVSQQTTSRSPQKTSAAASSWNTRAL